MIKNRTSKLFLLAVGAILFTACKGDGDVNYASGSKEAPQQVVVKEVKNQNGGAIIYYTLPDDPALKYVKAVYEIKPGVEADARASYYVDSLVVEGLQQGGKHQVRLYSVGYGEVASDPVLVEIDAKTPVFREISQTLKYDKTFSGVKVDFKNVTRAQVSIGVLKKQEDGKWTQLYMHYTEAPSGSFAIHGQDAVETEFGFYVRDRWGNLSDTVSFVTTPILEIECDKSLFKNAKLPTDEWECHKWASMQKNAIECVWDGRTMGLPMYHSKSVTMPRHITIDLGKTYKFSRFVYYTRYDNTSVGVEAYVKGHVHLFELYGSNHPNPNGEFDESWTKIGSFETKKASGGGPNDPVTEDDRKAAIAGEEFEVPAETEAYRYIRFRVLETWGIYGSWGSYEASSFIYIQELTFYGSEYPSL
ncbi:DUF5000 domain-containing lipoprotein [Parabacteroides pacaensis]|uniref:DUF5000 domain-containing lipoprotein n=1 Tax=Parabacteroides pacaensis TaxID=2086575 RepID=UPI000D1128B7|nr:DUF5000 domain-containing lipoprotein [Parabacteroides pacaensis]